MSRTFPRTRFTLIDQSTELSITTTSSSSPAALYMATYTSDKGSEDWQVVNNIETFTASQGGLNFEKHGLPQLTVAQAISTGAYVLCKRLVSADATLANAILHVRVRVVDGVSYLYYYATTVENAKSMTDVTADSIDAYEKDTDGADVTIGEGDDAVSASEYDIPILAFAPLGRGDCNLSVKISPNIVTSRSGNYMKYTLQILNTATGESMEDRFTFAMNPNCISDGKNQSIESKVNGTSTQVQVKLCEEGIARLIELVSVTLKDSNGNSYSADDVACLDFMSATDTRGNVLSGVITPDMAQPTKVVTADDGTTSTVTNEDDLWSQMKPDDITPISLSTTINLINGSYGTMGSAPIKNEEEYENLTLGAYGANGYDDPQFDPAIYDLDNYKVDAIFDCAYSWKIKNAILNVVDYRDDCMFFADLGFGNDTYDAVINAVENLTSNSRNMAVYHNYFKIYNPFTKKKIQVTLPFLLISRMTSHISTGVGTAVAGITNGFTFPEIIKGTVNFIPMTLPGAEQRQEFVDHMINYIVYYDNTPTLETMYTFLEDQTQLSYVSNVMAVQEIVKVIRQRCPKSRYTFMSSTDLDTYIADVETVLAQYSSNFDTLAIKYMNNSEYESNKIFYATLTVKFKNFIQEEYFEVYAIN